MLNPRNKLRGYIRYAKLSKNIKVSENKYDFKRHINAILQNNCNNCFY
jgi:hypothetical protein